MGASKTAIFFCFRPEILFLYFEQWSKNQNYQFKLKSAIWADYNIHNSMVLFTFPFSTEKLFLGKFDPKI